MWGTAPKLLIIKSKPKQMKQLSQEESAPLNGADIAGIIEGGVQFIDANKGWITDLFKKVSEWIGEIKQSPNSPHGRLMRIQALEAKDTLQKEWNKIRDAEIAELYKAIEELKAAK